MVVAETPTPDAGPADPSPRSIGRRAIAAARRALQLAPEAARRRKAGRKATDGAGKTSDLAAAELRVSPRTVDQAKVIVRRGTPALIEAVEQGGVSVAAGARLARLVPNAQAEGLARLTAGDRLPTVLAALEATPGAVPRFDDKRLDRLLAEVLRLLDLRMCVFNSQGDGNANEAVNLCRGGKDALRRWQRDGSAIERRTDALGQSIPPRALPGFTTLAEIEFTCRDIRGLMRRVERLATQPGGRAIPLSAVVDLFQHANGALWNARCNVLCEGCRHGTPPLPDGCPVCRGSGWAPPPGTVLSR